MHGIIGQLATDPVRLAIAIAAAIAFVAIIRCLSGLAFFHSAAPREQESQPREAANRNQRRQRLGRSSTSPSASPEE